MLTLHAGLPKTGTTFLQYRIFKRQQGIHYIHDPLDAENGAIERILRKYFRSEADSLESLEARLQKRLPSAEVLVSNENLSIMADEAWRGDGPPPSRFASRLRRLSSLVGGARIILGIRRQDQWLGSRYAESAKKFETFDQDDFAFRMKEISESPLNGSLQWMEYAKTYNHLAESLGHDNVLLVPSEELLLEPEAVLFRLEEFIGHRGLVDAFRTNKDPSGFRRNVLSEGKNTWNLRNRDSVITLPAALEESLLGRFREENRALDLIVGGRLRAHGYY